VPTVDAEGGEVRLSYEVTGAGREPIVLVHGFASDRISNWKATGWMQTLAEAGYRVVALDCRGHGQSGKPHEREAYREDRMADDVIEVMTHADVPEAHLMGYSMGGMISLNLLRRHSERFRSAVISGVGNTALTTRRPTDQQVVAEGLMAAHPEEITDPRARAFREFAEQGENDLRALAACMGRERARVDPAAFAGLEIPVLVVVGQGDELVGPADQLAAAIPGARLEIVPGDHLTAVAAPRFKDVVVAFLESVKAPEHHSRR
jgi:pimeloyl-ACP methyl ester carboxylesterase